MLIHHLCNLTGLILQSCTWGMGYAYNRRCFRYLDTLMNMYEDICIDATEHFLMAAAHTFTLYLRIWICLLSDVGSTHVTLPSCERQFFRHAMYTNLALDSLKQLWNKLWSVLVVTWYYSIFSWPIASEYYVRLLVITFQCISSHCLLYVLLALPRISSDIGKVYYGCCRENSMLTEF